MIFVDGIDGFSVFHQPINGGFPGVEVGKPFIDGIDGFHQLINGQKNLGFLPFMALMALMAPYRGRELGASTPPRGAPAVHHGVGNE